MVNIWFNELTKLRQTIQMEKSTTKKSSLVLKSRATRVLEEESRTGCSNSSKPGSALPVTGLATENQVSEETIFWLMDRFAPC